MHKTNALQVKGKVPPSFSYLETIDEEDYILDDQVGLFERKDYPHYSNVIKPHELPNEHQEAVFVQ